MKIVFISSECVPFASTGGLGEVAGSLPVELARMGHEVVRIMPLYRHVAEGGFGLHDLGLRVPVPLGLRTVHAEISDTNSDGVRTLFIGRDEFFDRRELYSLPQRDYDDNFERFVFFQKAAVELIDLLQLEPDVVHANDWQTGLIPFFLRHGTHGLGRPAPERSVFTIHNLAYQGVFPGSDFALTNLPYSCFTLEGMEFYGQISCLKSGLVAAGRVTTVSKTYAREIQTEQSGYGLDGVLRELGDNLRGIVNGIDYEVWDPGRDPHIAKTFGPGDATDGKAACRADLLAALGLPEAGKRRVIGMVSRLVDMKGIDVLAEAVEALLKRDVALVVLGSGQQVYHDLLRSWTRAWPDRVACRLGYDRVLAHKIYAGSDFILMPSRSEPCGLGQLVGMRYGALPIVHAVGGLEDTVEEISAGKNAGTGFKFAPCTADAMLLAVDRALALGKKPEAHAAAVSRAMQKDFSWRRAASEYVALYEEVSA